MGMAKDELQTTSDAGFGRVVVSVAGLCGEMLDRHFDDQVESSGGDLY
jgi:hypothetical protein